MKLKLFIISFFLSVSYFMSSAQDYGTGVGLRLGPSYGVTVKHFLDSRAALEGILYTRRGGFNVTGLYEVHATAFKEPRLKWYYGAGAHIGIWDAHRRHPWYDERDGDGNYLALGIDGIIGIEYTLQEIPLNFSLDWKPGINLVEHPGFWGDGLALSVRFVFR